ncbi:hypothetical protein GRS48_12675 [Halorubrum sp. JWXQ-INN 858]|uniref:hypothetical protein n=1 Tax=Halorubrum sp. JWXQ-INN 858 TaxID=2690782 RepID=UPI0013F9B674|nr:hypothetical protein [Halorubrum sp. JWXQ-INN 858]MWV65667.1 hypothetical protein [Halorubrum sp. JWXQ-INN 858]
MTEDIPQPAPEPYEPGNEVRIYIADDDPDSQHHDTRAVVVDRFKDSLGEETGRTLDAYSYRLKDASTNELLHVQFRHPDLAPFEDE